MYSFSKGHVVSKNSIIIDISGEEKEAYFSTFNENAPNLLEKVIVSWETRNGKLRSFKGKFWVDRSAIETLGFWERNSTYISKFDRRNGFGFKAEEFIIEKIIENGIRAERATPFEDEILGIDFWIFVKIENLWQWIPIDCTIRRDVDSKRGKKYNKGFKSGVIVVRVDPREVDGQDTFTFINFMGNLNTALKDFELCGNPIIKREYAKKQEELWNG